MPLYNEAPIRFTPDLKSERNPPLFPVLVEELAAGTIFEIYPPSFPVAVNELALIPQGST